MSSSTKTNLKFIFGALMLFALANGFTSDSGAQAVGYDAATVIFPLIGLLLIISAVRDVRKQRNRDLPD
jgi:hypothetical protein